MISERELDLLIVCPGNSKIIYQELSRSYSAIEPPIWGALLANFARRKGYGVQLIDQEAQGLTSDQVAAHAAGIRPRVTAVIVYGQQPSASTQNVTMGKEVASRIRQADDRTKIIMIGGHPSALPERTLRESEVDFVCQGEGPSTLQGLLELSNLNDVSSYSKVPGLWYWSDDQAASTPEATVIPQEALAQELPGMAWDLLPMDAYRAHNWHCFSHINERKPYASLYTSLGCPFRCTFCCINAPFGRSTIRCWDPKFVIQELDILAVKYRVKNIKIADEMFVLNERHVMELCDLIIERGYPFNFWAYARVDTVKDRFLEKLKRAGFNWLCLGIESGSQHVRDGVQKGRFGENDITTVVQKIKATDINVMGNYIFGLPDDDYESMQATLDLAIDLNCEMANFYSAMAYPGSKLYQLAGERGWALPEQWHDFSQHSYEQLPLPTEHVSAGEVLAFRDRAWQVYFTNPRYLNLVRRRFGPEVVDHLRELAAHTLRRKHAAPLKVEPVQRLERAEAAQRG